MPKEIRGSTHPRTSKVRISAENFSIDLGFFLKHQKKFTLSIRHTLRGSRKLYRGLKQNIPLFFSFEFGVEIARNGQKPIVLLMF